MNKVCVITGGSVGIGKAVVEQFLTEKNDAPVCCFRVDFIAISIYSITRTSLKLGTLKNAGQCIHTANALPTSRSSDTKPQ
jgi:NAD(P)-dependent dehydrogenase (short-subunit alcohol dehydrogenase family)